MQEAQHKPTRTVAIVGRPNVGKSALFNRLVGRRLAIVHEEWGVTRDRLVSEAQWDGQRFQLIDTGGIGLMDRAVAAADSIAAGTRRQVDAAIEDAAAIVMVVDIQAGRAPLDEEVAALLHRSGRPVFVAANKADNPARDEKTNDFARLGFPVFPVSALHNRGCDELMARVLAELPPAGEDASVAHPLAVAVIGRPNAGKSSYINRLLNDERVIVSEMPGTTRDNIEIPFTVGEGPQARHYLLIDTAGMRPSRRVDTAVEKFSLIRITEAVQRCDVAVLMMDASQGPSRQDKKIADLIAEKRKGCVLLVNKWDHAAGTGVTEKDYRAAVLKELPFIAFAPMLFISAKTGQRVRESVETIDQVAAQISMTLATGLLNRTLRDAFDKKSPPAIRGRRFKLFYATQTGTRPVRLKLFVNDPKLLVGHYETFLIHQLREAFGLEGAPIHLQWVARERREFDAPG